MNSVRPAGTSALRPTAIIRVVIIATAMAIFTSVCPLQASAQTDPPIGTITSPSWAPGSPAQKQPVLASYRGLMGAPPPAFTKGVAEQADDQELRRKGPHAGLYYDVESALVTDIRAYTAIGPRQMACTMVLSDVTVRQRVEVRHLRVPAEADPLPPLPTCATEQPPNGPDADKPQYPTKEDIL